MRKVAAVLAGIAALGAIVLGFAASGQANQNVKDSCLKAVAGVYLNLVGNQPSQSSSLVTISAQGLLQATDSDQDGDAGSFDPFTDSHGLLTGCAKVGHGSYHVQGYTLDYSQPELVGHSDPGVAGGMARVNYDVTISGDELTGQGVLTSGLAPQDGAAAAKSSTGVAQFTFGIAGERLQ